MSRARLECSLGGNGRVGFDRLRFFLETSGYPDDFLKCG
jgi:hypothetical protein